MNSALPITGSLRTPYMESSPLSSPRESSATPRAWRKGREVSRQTQYSTRALEQLQRDLNQLRINRIAFPVPMHPFKIYQGDTWLKWFVSKGEYIYTPTGEQTEATGTDTEITISSGVAKYYFFIDISTGAVTASATKPTWSAAVINIGYVDTATYETEEKAVIHQFIHDNIFSPCE